LTSAAGGAEGMTGGAEGMTGDDRNRQSGMRTAP
jgi:hypothetical protein